MKNLKELIAEFAMEGFRRPVVYPGFLVGRRRRKPRYLTYQASDRSVTLHDQFPMTSPLKQGDVLVLEVVIEPVEEGVTVLAVKVPMDEPADLTFLYPRLEAILAALARIRW